jgi:hypothetical protein
MAAWWAAPTAKCGPTQACSAPPLAEELGRLDSTVALPSGAVSYIGVQERLPFRECIDTIGVGSAAAKQKWQSVGLAWCLRRGAGSILYASDYDSCR